MISRAILLAASHPCASQLPRGFFFISNTFLKLFPKLTLYFFIFKYNTFGCAYCHDAAKQRYCTMHGGVAAAMTWHFPGPWPLTW